MKPTFIRDVGDISLRKNTDCIAALRERGEAERPEGLPPDDIPFCAGRYTDEGRIGLASRSLHVPRSLSAGVRVIAVVPSRPGTHTGS